MDNTKCLPDTRTHPWEGEGLSLRTQVVWSRCRSALAGAVRLGVLGWRGSFRLQARGHVHEAPLGELEAAARLGHVTDSTVSKPSPSPFSPVGGGAAGAPGQAAGLSSQALGLSFPDCKAMKSGTYPIGPWGARGAP